MNDSIVKIVIDETTKELVSPMKIDKDKLYHASDTESANAFINSFFPDTPFVDPVFTSLNQYYEHFDEDVDIHYAMAGINGPAGGFLFIRIIPKLVVESYGVYLGGMLQETFNSLELVNRPSKYRAANGDIIEE